MNFSRQIELRVLYKVTDVNQMWSFSALVLVLYITLVYMMLVILTGQLVCLPEKSMIVRKADLLLFI